MLDDDLLHQSQLIITNKTNNTLSYVVFILSIVNYIYIHLHTHIHTHAHKHTHIHAYALICYGQCRQSFNNNYSLKNVHYLCHTITKRDTIY